MIKDLKGIKPNIHKDTFVAETASVMGDVTIGEGSSVWFSSVVRGDIEKITIGKFTNIQDNATVHTETDIPTILGDYVVVGHNAIIHGCSIGNNSLIGMGATVLNNVVIGKNCIIGAGSVITEGKIIPDDSMVIGLPGKIVRRVSEKEAESIKENAIRYYNLWQKHVE